MPSFLEKFTQKQTILSPQEVQAILAQADLRKRQQELKISAINIAKTSKLERDGVKAVINKEASGETAEKFTKEQAYELVPPLLSEAEESQGYAPLLASFDFARTAKILQLTGFEYQEYLEQAQNLSDIARPQEIKVSPAVLLPDAYIIGIQTRMIKGLPMPDIKKVAQAVDLAPEILAQYALVLAEKDRQEFLNQFSEDKRRNISVILDKNTSAVLHSAIVEKGTDEDKQRKEVRMRVFNELKNTIAEKNPKDRKIARLLSESMRQLGSDSQQLLLEILRDEVEDRKFNAPEKLSADHLPWLVKVLVEEFEDFRGNDLVMHLAADDRTPPNLAIYFYNKLVKNRYIDKDVEEWWNERKKSKSASGKKEESEDKLYRLDILRKIINDLGVMPTKTVIEFISDDSRWKKGRQVLDLEQRVAQIKDSQSKFENLKNNKELVSQLRSDENIAMTYYLLYGGNDRFNLINNYDFKKFWEILGLIDDLKIHNQPLKMFDQALRKEGKADREREAITERLNAGHFPLDHPEHAYQEVSFEVSENAALKNANSEIGKVMGKGQLGVVLLAPLYREYLTKDDSVEAQGMAQKLSMATTFTERLQVITEIESRFTDYNLQAQKQLEEPWKALGEKMLLEMPVESILNNDFIQMRGEDLLPKLDTKRLDLKRMKKEVLVMLKGDNKQLNDLQKNINQKKKARKGLIEGLDRQTDSARKKDLQKKVEEIEGQIKGLEQKREGMSNLLVNERYAHLTEEEKKTEMDYVSKEIIALTEKDPSAIFTYLLMQLIDEDKLTESDLNLVKEMESHLQGPFNVIKDKATYQKPSEEKKRQRIGLRYLDKAQRLMSMVRFADSKICCFSSNNYEMKVQHDTPNKYWVASINADPMSFVISMEMPQAPAQEGQKQVHENLGFIFGSFGVDDNKNLALMLNGIYYAPGVENEEQVRIILEGVEKIFTGSGAKTLAMATQYGGSFKMPQEFSSQAIEMTRLRALDDNNGDPESKIYDDLNTGNDLNKLHDYGNVVWHKRVEL
ncbi:MAG: hypothetical protein NTX82_00465 [Candidatus Parcubacteria bacterium]|nr:hypothetical protein [Candidatus Parcubacteria bacterium]